MFTKRTQETAGRATLQADSLLDACLFAASADGRLTVQPLHATLTGESLTEIIARLSDPEVAEGWVEVTFDLSRVKAIGPQWTLILATLIHFARGVKARCRIVSLNEQPAAAASLYRNNAELMNLLAA